MSNTFSISKWQDEVTKRDKPSLARAIVRTYWKPI